MKLNSDLLAKAAGLERFEQIALDRFELYASLLSKANSKINLFSRAVDPSLEITNQIAISLMARRLMKTGTASWIDIGSGGGFPVVPMAIVEQSIQFTAVEPIAKKVYFIERSVQELGLRNLQIESKRIEEFMSGENARQWDVVSIKAVTDLDQSLFWASRLLFPDGMIITYKPQDSTLEDLQVLDQHGFEHACSLDVKEVIDTINLHVVAYKMM